MQSYCRISTTRIILTALKTRSFCAMAPISGLHQLRGFRPIRSLRSAATQSGAYNERFWSGPLSVASVDLLAMVVSDAGLASTEPEWWNSAPLGCILIAVQPRGGWQVLQRGVQWGSDSWARSFGVNCKMPVLYCYFSCSMRNRLEVWNSQNFVSPMIGSEEEFVLPNIPKVEASTAEPTVNAEIAKSEPSGVQDETAKEGKSNIEDAKESKPPSSPDTGWKQFRQYNGGKFTIRRPTKLTDGSRGGQGFICSLLCPGPGNAYGVEEQARFQFLSIIIVAAGLVKTPQYQRIKDVMKEDFDLTTNLGVVFTHLSRYLIIADFVVISFVVSVFYSLWGGNVYGAAAPYVIQLCSLISWTLGAAGLLMLGGNPRVDIVEGKTIPRHILNRLDSISPGLVELNFGSLHGSIFTQDRGSFHIDRDIVKAICGWDIRLTRTMGWHCAMIWYALHIATSVALQVAGSKVATVYSQIMGILLLVLTSVVRGQGVSGPEEWMIPDWKMRKNAGYGVKLQGQIQARLK